MVDKNIVHKILNVLIAIIWIANGFFCKVLNLVPRHQAIVSRILGKSHAAFFTKAIGIAETLMAVWILSGIKSRLNTATQIIIIAVMNFMEFLLVPDLLLWGRVNAIFAFLFTIIIYYNEFKINKQSAK